MHLDHRGHPLHTRVLSVTLVEGEAGRITVHGAVYDLRKRGFVPVGGDLQPSGPVHHMELDAVIERASGVVERMAIRQPTVAFEPSIASRGESCRDPAGNVHGLVGARVDEGWTARLSSEIGGPRGCSHVLTLAHLLGATAAWGLERDRTLVGSEVARPTGQRILRRDVVVDGAEVSPGRIELALQLTEVHYRPVAEPAPAMDRFAGEIEVRAIAGVDVRRYALCDVRLGERRRLPADVATAGWHDRPDVVERLNGLSLARGVSRALLDLFGERPDDRPLLDLLLMLSPALIQVFAAVVDTWPATAANEGWVIGTGGRVDSCWMWRKDSALWQTRAPGDPPVR
jgi:hypothetical protein